MRSFFFSTVCICIVFTAKCQTFDTNSMYFQQGDVMAKYLSFTVIEDGVFETYTVMPDTAVLNSDPAKNCDQMKETHNPQGFRVFCGPSVLEFTGRGWRATCKNTSEIFCVMVHEDLFP